MYNTQWRHIICLHEIVGLMLHHDTVSNRQHLTALPPCVSSEAFVVIYQNAFPCFCTCHQPVGLLQVTWLTWLSLTSSVSSQSKMPQQGWQSIWDVVTTSLTRSSACTGFACRSELHSIKGGDADVSCHGCAPAPPYLASSFTCVADMPHWRTLRSASTEQLDVPICSRSTVRGRAFPVAGAKGVE